jgi:hypothetical protein
MRFPVLKSFNIAYLLVLIIVMNPANIMAAGQPAAENQSKNSSVTYSEEKSRTELKKTRKRHINIHKNKTQKSPKKVFRDWVNFIFKVWLFAIGISVILFGILFIVDYAGDQFFEYLGIWIGPALILLGIGIVILSLRK